MKINKKKQVMKCTKKNQDQPMDIEIAQERINEVKELCYLGSQITNDGRSNSDIKCRIAQAKRAFQQKRNLLASNIN